MKQNSLSTVVVWQTVSKFLLQGIAFFTTPIFTRLLSTNDYGCISIYGTWVSIFALFIGLQTSGSIPMAIVKYENNLNKYLSSIMLLSFFSFLLIFILVFLTRNYLSKILGLDTLLVLMICVQSFFSFVIGFFSTKLIQQKKVKINFFISLLITLLSTFLSLFFLWNLNCEKYFSKLLGNFIPLVLVGFILFNIVIFQGKCIKKEYLIFCLSISIPLIFHGAGDLILGQSDRIMIKKIIGDNEVGIYSIAANLVSILSIIWASFNSSWVPFYYEYRKNNSYDEIISKSQGYMFTFTIITLGFLMCSPEVFKLMAPITYWKGISYVPFFVLSVYFNFLYSFPVNFEFYAQNTKMIATGTVITALLNIILNYFLIKRYSGFGAVFATVISFSILFIFHDIIARFFIRNDKYHYNYFFYFKGLLVVLIFIAIYYIFIDLWYIRWILAIILGIILIVKFIKTKSVF